MKRKAEPLAPIQEAIDGFARDHPALMRMCESIDADGGSAKVMLSEATGNLSDPWRQRVSTWRPGDHGSLLAHVRGALRSMHDKHLGAFCREKMGKCLDTISGDEQILLKYYDLLPEDVDTLLTLGALGLFRAATVLDLRRTGLDGGRAGARCLRHTAHGRGILDVATRTAPRRSAPRVHPPSDRGRMVLRMIQRRCWHSSFSARDRAQGLPGAAGARQDAKNRAEAGGETDEKDRVKELHPVCGPAEHARCVVVLSDSLHAKPEQRGIVLRRSLYGDVLGEAQKELGARSFIAEAPRPWP